MKTTLHPCISYCETLYYKIHIKQPWILPFDLIYLWFIQKQKQPHYSILLHCSFYY